MSETLIAFLLDSIIKNSPVFFIKIDGAGNDIIEPSIFCVGNIDDFISVGFGNEKDILSDFTKWLKKNKEETVLPCSIVLADVDKSFAEPNLSLVYGSGQMVPTNIVIDSDGDILVKNIKLDYDLDIVGGF